MPASRLSVIAFSEAFCAFWRDLARDLRVPIDMLDVADVAVPASETAALVLAAGGAERDALQWLEARRVPPGVPVLVVGTDPGRRTAMQLVARGASDYFALPEDLEIFRNAVAAALSGGRGADRARAGSSASPFADIVGESPAIRQALARAVQLLPHRNARVLILGETGTGKELLARAIHAGGPRSAAPFVAVNCSAFPEHLIESELFGHERGAFTDAHAAKPGLFEVADGGTLFLDEIAELPVGLQAKLLRVLEDGQVRRVGGTRPRSMDVRILAATDEHLQDLVHAGGFRADLFFRLSAITIRLPALRERGEDVLLIAQSLLRRLAAEHALPVPPLTADVRQRLQRHPWPGNVRELKNALERALLLAPAGELNAAELLSPIEGEGQRDDGAIPFPAPLRAITTAAARATVQMCGGNRKESARRLRISPKRLRRLLAANVGAGSLLEQTTEAPFVM